MSASGLTNRRPNAYRSRPRAIARRCNPSLPWTLLAQHHRETQLPACQLDRRKSAHILTRRASEGRWPRQVQDAQSIPSLARRLVWTVGDPSVSRYRIAVPVRARTVGAKTEKNRRNPLTGSHWLPCPEKIARARKPSSPFHRTLARGRCCVLQASRCHSRFCDRQIQIHRGGFPIRPRIAQSWVSFHQPVA